VVVDEDAGSVERFFHARTLGSDHGDPVGERFDGDEPIRLSGERCPHEVPGGNDKDPCLPVDRPRVLLCWEDLKIRRSYCGELRVSVSVSPLSTSSVDLIVPASCDSEEAVTFELLDERIEDLRSFELREVDLGDAISAGSCPVGIPNRRPDDNARIGPRRILFASELAVPDHPMMFRRQIRVVGGT
jgi:hypothetical protein